MKNCVSLRFCKFMKVYSIIFQKISKYYVLSSISVLIQKWFKYFFQFGNFEMTTFEAQKRQFRNGFGTLTIPKTEKGFQYFKVPETDKGFQYLDSRNEKMVPESYLEQQKDLHYNLDLDDNPSLETANLCNKNTKLEKTNVDIFRKLKSLKKGFQYAYENNDVFSTENKELKRKIRASEIDDIESKHLSKKARAKKS
ncbi:hypothetical protein C1646_669929 [Rhizophagus diaphanus]|nr:hypothetical protein C1646_669929 [Rhizophagus diaphanus] [Rhizophagus sp. MUCL 43196]